MFSDAECRSLAEQYLARIAQMCDEDLVLLPTEYATASTLVYTYQTVDYVATGDLTHALAGNGPLLVCKLDGVVAHAGTAIPVEACIRDFENRNVVSATGRELGRNGQ